LRIILIKNEEFINDGGETMAGFQKKTPEQELKQENIEVWEDLVSIKDLVMSLAICSISALGGYFIAPNTPPKPLFFGLGGAFIGFLICTLFIKPKRDLIETKLED
jgi:hypothetical protein